MSNEELAKLMASYQRRRVLLGVSSDEFGRELGCSGSAIRSWETMRNPPKPAYVTAMGILLEDLEAGRKTLRRCGMRAGSHTKIQEPAPALSKVTFTKEEVQVLTRVLEKILTALKGKGNEPQPQTIPAKIVEKGGQLIFDELLNQ